MSTFKVGSLVSIRGAGTPHPGQVRPARITALGGGTLVTAVVKGAETYVNVPQWTRVAPTTTGWTR